MNCCCWPFGWSRSSRMRFRAPLLVTPPARATASPTVVSGRVAKTEGLVTSPETATRISGSITNWGF